MGHVLATCMIGVFFVTVEPKGKAARRDVDRMYLVSDESKRLFCFQHACLGNSRVLG